jgi:uncharacterized protein
MMDLTDIPVIDAHCHPFTNDLYQLTEGQLRDILQFRLEGGSAPEAVDTMTAHLFVRDIADYLGCAPTLRDVVRARNEQSTDYSAYTTRMFDSVGLRALLPDTGYPYWTKVTLDDCAKTVKKQAMYEVYRVESTFSTRNGIYMEDRALDFDTYLERFIAAATDAVQENGCVGLKTVIAYRTGLSIRPVTFEEAKAAYAEDTDTNLAAQKTVRDYLFKQTALLAAKLGVPMVIHTGFTAMTKPWAYGDPTQLSPALMDPELRETTFHLLHGGFPWTSGAGYMAANHPNVYVDLSELNPAASIHVERHFEELLAFAPLSKLTFGSDGIGIPELFWYATILAKRAVGNILERFVQQRLLRPEKAEDYAAQIFHATAKRIYHLSAHLED